MMRNIFQNKKILISIIVAVVVIVVAIVLFVVLGKSGDNKKSDGNSTIKFSEENKNNNKTLTNSSNETSNKTGNNTNTSNGGNIGANVDKFYKDVAEKFTDAFMDTDEMTDFIDNYIDLKAYVAYENINGDETKFLSEYESISDEDPRIEETKQACMQIPASYNMMLGFIDMAIQMGQSAGSESAKNEINYESFTDEDKRLVLKDIAQPEQSKDDENITKLTVTYSWMQEDVDVNMIFYGNVIIFICDEDGTSLTDSGLDSNTDLDADLPGTDEEN